MRQKTVEIQLATYNGATYLGAFLDSLLAQEDGDFTLRVRDDCSSDGTPGLLEDYAPRFGGRMIVEPADAPSGSAKGNFARLIGRLEADYLLWADQDDVWRPNKVAELRRLLDAAEAEHGADMPVYAFTDAVPVNAELTPLEDSYLAFKQLDPDRMIRLRSALVCAPMPGCASGINAALARRATPVPVDAVTGHDWWAFLLAAAAGRLVHSPEPTVLYRQHGANVSQQQRNSVRSYSAGSAGGRRARVRRGMTLRYRQAQAVHDHLDPVAEAGARAVIEAFTRTEAMSPVARRLALLRGGFLYPDMTRNAAMLALC